jgi:hypothetical protein
VGAKLKAWCMADGKRRGYGDDGIYFDHRGGLQGQRPPQDLCWAVAATILAGQGEADTATNIAGQMLDKAVGMESRRIQDRIVAVRDAITAVSDGRAARDLSERVEDVIGVPM